MIRDLLLTNSDLTLDHAGNVGLITGNHALTQNIRHRLIESGLPASLMGETSELRQSETAFRMGLEVEKDIRVKPGSAFTTLADGVIVVRFQTMWDQLIEVSL